MQGAGPLVNRLSRFDRDIYLILQREVRAAAGLVRDKAANFLPSGNALSNWGQWSVGTGRNDQVGAVTLQAGTQDLTFNASRVQASLKAQARKTRTGIVGRVVLSDPAGVFFATTGKTAHTRFTRNLIDRYGENYPRALGRAWEMKAPEAGDRIDRALERAQEAVA